jgi:hypothetical protein
LHPKQAAAQIYYLGLGELMWAVRVTHAGIWLRDFLQWPNPGALSGVIQVLIERECNG